MKGSVQVSCNLAAGITPLLPWLDVYKHEAGQSCNGVACLFAPHISATKNRDYIASLWLLVPAAFRGRLLAPILPNAERTLVQPAILAERGKWQRIWTSGYFPENIDVKCAVWADLDTGDTFYTTGWTMEGGHVPGAYLLDDGPQGAQESSLPVSDRAEST